MMALFFVLVHPLFLFFVYCIDRLDLAPLFAARLLDKLGVRTQKCRIHSLTISFVPGEARYTHNNDGPVTYAWSPKTTVHSGLERLSFPRCTRWLVPLFNLSDSATSEIDDDYQAWSKFCDYHILLEKKSS